MKIIQLNAWGGKLQYQIPQFLKSQNADIVCLQEIHDLKGPSGALFVTLDELKENTSLYFAEMSATHSFNYMNRSLEYGNAILSKTPIVSNTIVFTQGQYKKDFDMLNDPDARNFQHAQIRYGNKTLNVINYHGPFLANTKAGTVDTERQVSILCDYITKLQKPIIVAGDFNLVSRSKSLSRLNNIMRNLSVEYGLTSTYSVFNSHNVVCDYIFVDSSANVQNFNASDELVSDHKPLILELDI